MKCDMCGHDALALAAELAAVRRDRQDLADRRGEFVERVYALEAALRKLIKGYVNTLESGAIAIQAYGGKCDSVEVMEAGDPHLIEAKAVLASALETKVPPDPKCRDAGYVMQDGVLVCENCKRPAEEIFAETK